MPKFQHFNDLPVTTYEELKADIAQKGVLIPVILDEEGTVLDGHQRRRICAELHIECPAVVMPGLTEDEKHVFAIVVNAFRRHLTGPARSQAVGHLSQLGWSDRRIASAVGVSHQTVSRSRDAGGPSGPPEPPPNIDPETGEVLPLAPASDESAADPSPPAQTTPAADPAPRKVLGKDDKTYTVKPAPVRREKPPTNEEIVERIGKGIVAFGEKLEQHDAPTTVAAFLAEAQADRIEDLIGRLRKYADALTSALNDASKLKAV